MSEVDKHHSNNDVVLSLPEDKFADIIINFLGKKEKIRYRKSTYFIVELQDITQFYYLLDEKIKKNSLPM